MVELKLNRIALCAGALAITAGLVYLSRAVGANRSSGQPAALDQTQAITTATTAFLNGLNPDQRHKVQFPFIAEKNAHAAKFARSGPPGDSPAGPGMGPMGGGDSTMHVHTMYLDPTNDYGVQFNGAE
jgi:hypothetical protein